MNKNDHGQWICTAETPWDGREGAVVHPDAEDDGGCSDGCCDDYRCPNCGHKFRVEGADA